MARSRLPTGTTPWDTLNGFRIGAVAGALAGAAVALLTGTGLPSLIAIGAVLGAAIGYATEKRRARRR